MMLSPIFKAPVEIGDVVQIRGYELADPANPTEIFARAGPGYGFFGDLEVASGDLYYSDHAGTLARSGRLDS